MHTRLAHAQIKNDTPPRPQGTRAVRATYPQADPAAVILSNQNSFDWLLNVTQSPRKAFSLFLKAAYKSVESGQDYPGFSARRAAFIAQMRRPTG